MRQRLLGLAMGALLVAMSPLSVLADEPKVYDGRLEGYGRSVTLDGGGTSLTWLLLVGLGIVGLAVMFKHARRSHLD